MYTSENLLEVNPMMINYKIRHNKNRPAKHSLACLDHFSVTCAGRKTEKHCMDM